MSLPSPVVVEFDGIGTSIQESLSSIDSLPSGALWERDITTSNTIVRDSGILGAIRSSITNLDVVELALWGIEGEDNAVSIGVPSTNVTSSGETSNLSQDGGSSQDTIFGLESDGLSEGGASDGRKNGSDTDGKAHVERLRESPSQSE